jgi:hypothetical protein
MATRVRVRNGNHLTTDGPFVETTERLDGFFLVQAANLDETIAIRIEFLPRAKERSRFAPLRTVQTAADAVSRRRRS